MVHYSCYRVCLKFCMVDYLHTTKTLVASEAQLAYGGQILLYNHGQGLCMLPQCRYTGKTAVNSHMCGMLPADLMKPMHFLNCNALAGFSTPRAQTASWPRLASLQLNTHKRRCRAREDKAPVAIKVVGTHRGWLPLPFCCLLFSYCLLPSICHIQSDTPLAPPLRAHPTAPIGWAGLGCAFYACARCGVRPSQLRQLQKHAPGSACGAPASAAGAAGAPGLTVAAHPPRPRRCSVGHSPWQPSKQTPSLGTQVVVERAGTPDRCPVRSHAPFANWPSS